MRFVFTVRHESSLRRPRTHDLLEGIRSKGAFPTPHGHAGQLPRHLEFGRLQDLPSSGRVHNTLVFEGVDSAGLRPPFLVAR